MKKNLYDVCSRNRSMGIIFILKFVEVMGDFSVFYLKYRNQAAR